MTSKDKPINQKHFLIIGSKGYLYHTKYALDTGIKTSLLIERDKYKPEFRKLFTSVFIVENIFDFNQIKSAIQNKNIDAIFTRFEDYIAVVGVLNEYLKLEGITYQASRNFGNKYQMKSKWLEANVPCAKGVCADKKENIDNFLSTHQFPLILKKTSGTHSSFVYKVKSKLDLEEKLNLLITEGKSYKVSKPIINFKDIDTHECDIILEEMLDGIEITVDTFVSNNQFTHTPICQYIMPEEVQVNDSYLPSSMTPVNLSKSIKNRVYKATKNALQALGAKNGAYHTELFYNKKIDTLWLIETTARGGGYRSLLMNTITNSDYDKNIFKAAAGQLIDNFTPNGKACSTTEYFAEKKGIITKMDLDFLNDLDNVEIISIKNKVGDQVKKGKNGGKNILAVALYTDNENELKSKSIELFEKIRSSITIE